MSEKSAKMVVRRGFTPAKPGWKANSIRARSVGEFVPNLMRPAFEKFGFPAAAILTDWAAIAGPELASYTAPERLKWPRKTAGAADVASEKGALLILRVAGARALEVDHLRPRLIERINAAFGYRAVSEIRIIQAPLPKSGRDSPADAAAGAGRDHQLVAALPEGPLKHALARMAAGVKSRRDRSEPAAF
jgi:hypothetical protein